VIEVSWQAGLVGEVGKLGPEIETRVVSAPAPSDEVVAAERFLDLDYLREAVTRSATTPLRTQAGEEHDGEIKLNIALSRFTRHYVGSLTVAAMTGLVHGLGLDLSVDRCRIVMWSNLPFALVLDADDTQIVTCSERPSPWPTGGRTVSDMVALRQAVWRKLYAEHITPLFARARELTNVSTNTMWSNAAEWVACISDGALEYAGIEAAEPFTAERVALLNAESLPGVPGSNPLRDLVEWVPSEEDDFPLGVLTRVHCCMTYLLPEKLGRLCANCPFLPLDDRIALFRERHDAPLGAPGGPAERRSIELGLEKVAEDRVTSPGTQ
jgi:hypothetical protein